MLLFNLGIIRKKQILKLSSRKIVNKVDTTPKTPVYHVYLLTSTNSIDNFIGI